MKFPAPLTPSYLHIHCCLEQKVNAFNDTEPYFNLWDVSTSCPPSIKRVTHPGSVSIDSKDETKRGPCLSLCTLRGPRLNALTQQIQREKENKRREGEEREKGFKHSQAHFLPRFLCSRKHKEGRMRREEGRKGGKRKEGCKEKEVEE